MKAFLFHSNPCRERNEKLWNCALGAPSPGTLHRCLGAAFQPSLLRSSGKHAHVGQLRLPGGWEGYVNLSEDVSESYLGPDMCIAKGLLFLLAEFIPSLVI